jgi:hypothetical protein
MYLRTRESKSVMALIAGSTPVGADENSFVNDVLQEPLSSGLVNRRTTAVGTIKRLPKDTHDKLLRFWLGPALYTKIHAAA